MKRRFKVMKVGWKSKTVLNEYDPTRVTKIVSINAIRYFDTRQKAMDRIEKMVAADELADAMDRSWGAPSECFENQTNYDYYVVDRTEEQWYEIRNEPVDPNIEDPFAEDVEWHAVLSECETPEIQKDWVM